MSDGTKWVGTGYCREVGYSVYGSGQPDDPIIKQATELYHPLPNNPLYEVTTTKHNDGAGGWYITAKTGPGWLGAGKPIIDNLHLIENANGDTIFDQNAGSVIGIVDKFELINWAITIIRDDEEGKLMLDMLTWRHIEDPHPEKTTWWTWIDLKKEVEA